MIKKFLTGILALFFVAPAVFADNMWINNLRNSFLSNNAIIYEINLRTFGAQDVNNDGIIDFSEGEESGNFLNAIARLDEIRSLGVNTLHIMPVMELGKVKALGNAGSLYAPISFTKLNPQLKSNRSALSIEDQAIKFIDEAHKRKLAVIFDLPSCASYELYLKRPDLFVKDASGQPVIPADWTDVRLLDSNIEVYNLYKNFVDYVISLGVDGIRADAAYLKPAKFWKDLIDYSHTKDPQFMWLAESSESWTTPVAKQALMTPYDKLLNAGFDGFYGSFFNLKNCTNSTDLVNYLKSINDFRTKYNFSKSVIGSFATHDELSPLLINGPQYSKMIMWLNATLPINSYSVDGFSSGDNYVYMWGNKKARKTFTDNDTYFVHRGKLDIFNFSRRPGSKHKELMKNFVLSNGFKIYISNMIANGKYTWLKTTNNSVFAYALSYNNKTILVFGNLNFKGYSEDIIHLPHFDDSLLVIPIQLDGAPKVGKNQLQLKLMPGEMEVLIINDYTL